MVARPQPSVPPPFASRPAAEPTEAGRPRVSWATARRAPVTAALLAAAVAVSVAMMLGWDASALVLDERGLATEPWRIFATVLPHLGVIHILFNGVWTWQLGYHLERTTGSLRTAAIYLVIAFISSLGQYASGSVGVGLSGVVYGQVAVLFLLQRDEARRTVQAGAEGGGEPATRLRETLGTVVTKSTLRLFVGWFFVCIVLTYADILRIGNVAHGMGAVSGLSVGWWMVSKRRAVAGSLLVVLAGLTFVAAKWGTLFLP